MKYFFLGFAFVASACVFVGIYTNCPCLLEIGNAACVVSIGFSILLIVMEEG